MNWQVFTAIAAVTILCGCQGVQYNTPSGRPEVTIKAPAKDVKTVFVGTLTNLRYSLKKDSDFQIVMEKPIDNAMVNVLMSSQYDPTVEARITATFLEIGPETRVTTELGVIRNGGSAFEASTDVSNSNDSRGVQALLQEIKAGLEGGQTVEQVTTTASQRSITDRAKAAMKPAQ